MAIANQLAEWIVKTKIEEIPVHVLEKAKLSVLDTLGCITGGVTDDAGGVMIEYLKEVGGILLVV